MRPSVGGKACESKKVFDLLRFVYEVERRGAKYINRPFSFPPLNDILREFVIRLNH